MTNEFAQRLLAERLHAQRTMKTDVLESLHAAILVEDVLDVVLSDEQIIAMRDDDDILALFIAPARGD